MPANSPRWMALMENGWQLRSTERELSSTAARVISSSSSSSAATARPATCVAGLALISRARLAGSDDIQNASASARDRLRKHESTLHTCGTATVHPRGGSNHFS
jgi:hypothetical protein